MTNREFFIQRWEIEGPITRKVLKALPEGGLDYKPHEPSNSAGTISWLLAEELRGLAEIVENGEVHWVTRPHPDSFAKIVEAYEENARRLSDTLSRADEARWQAEGKFSVGGHVIFAAPRGDHCWWILLDEIHHRGQLTAYIRPMGGKVPAVYGPSADEKIAL